MLDEQFTTKTNTLQNQKSNRKAGHLILVVGPSGVGKDSLLDSARQSFASEDRFVFVKRYITRSADAGGEEHIELSPREFDVYVTEAKLAMHWEAHGYRYGLPIEIINELEDGKCVIANVSRNIIHEACERFDNLSVLNVTATAEILHERLSDRGRESVEEIRRRLDRQASAINGDYVFEIPNNETIELAENRFNTLIRLISLGFRKCDSRFTFS